MAQAEALIDGGRALPAATFGLVAVSVLAGAIPGLPAALEYDRDAVLRGGLHRVMTGQIVHWSAGMALADLGVVALAGAWLEIRSRLLASAAAVAGAILAGSALVVLRADVTRYRGASAIAVALVAAAALDLVLRGRTRPARLIGLLALALLLAKIAAEMLTGASVLSGTLPPGVALVAETHAAGALGGGTAAIAVHLRASRGR